MSDLPQRLYQTKLTLLAVIFVVVGLGLLALSHNAHGGIFRILPVADIGSGLFTTGLIGVALQYLDARDADQRASERLRRVLTEEAPTIRDAVVNAMAFTPEALTAVTSPEVIERVVQNCLTEQLGNAQLASSLHARLREQAMAPNDRLRDSRLSVTIRKSAQRELLQVTVRREYRFTPKVDTLRFACVSHADDFETLLRDPETAEVWRVRTSDGLKAEDQSTFALTDVELDGETRPFRRSPKSDSQVYTCRLGKPETATAVRHLSYSFDMLIPRSKHCLYFYFGRPTHGLAVDVTFDASVPELRLIDFVGTPADLRHSRHATDAGGDCSVATDDWVFPRAGVVVVWK